MSAKATARTLWKGVVKLGAASVPVKLYGAVDERTVRFRLLHDKDSQPVSQTMVHPETGKTVEPEEMRRGYVMPGGDVVVVSPKELESIEPKESRVIQLLRFLPAEAIDHRFYARPYYLGPDGSADEFAALAAALERTGKVGVARWVMRKQDYVGALRLHRGQPILVTLRNAEEVPSLASLEVPEGPPLDKRELAMARQLVKALESDFDPLEYRDEYRKRVMELIDSKAHGRHLKLRRPKAPRPSLDLADALRRSLRREVRKHA